MLITALTSLNMLDARLYKSNCGKGCERAIREVSGVDCCEKNVEKVVCKESEVPPVCTKTIMVPKTIQVPKIVQVPAIKKVYPQAPICERIKQPAKCIKIAQPPLVIPQPDIIKYEPVPDKIVYHHQPDIIRYECPPGTKTEFRSTKTVCKKVC